jgi:hypothetical protein
VSSSGCYSAAAAITTTTTTADAHSAAWPGARRSAGHYRRPAKEEKRPWAGDRQGRSLAAYGSRGSLARKGAGRGLPDVTSVDGHAIGLLRVRRLPANLRCPAGNAPSRGAAAGTRLTRDASDDAIWDCHLRLPSLPARRGIYGAASEPAGPPSEAGASLWSAPPS